jgi:tetratricopeptide (TPR) repeat protein
MRSWLAVYGTLAFLLLALLSALPQSALALTASQVYEQVKDSVVVVKAYDRQGKLTGLGSGVMLPSGDIITNYHVVKSGARYTVGRGKQATLATLKTGDPDKDLCLLTARNLTAKPAHLGKASKLKVGEPVFAVGAPQGLELSLSEGIASQLRGGPPPIIQTTVAISKGSSGGGLFNAKGELVGITTFYLKGGQSLNFAVPVEWIGEMAAGTWYDRGWALYRAQDWPGLLAHSRRWTQAEPGNALAWDSLGNAYENLGRRREAIAAYRETLRLEPNNPFAWINLAMAYAQSGNRSAALEAVKELRRYDPKSADELFDLIMKP